ncbi:non-ribosomal peptide synthetase [Streptomyces sp. SID13588]|uniref:non-ribosomal peptide synthetase n=1 Tax=Streptomyces sp. SID13588 TaxID=2706051 RepID=UPI0013CA481A|nr:non-ribosomal peptide synthetase [Streptomyces sp. SID13588]NEA73788.1 non-ribosomal peptide synthetase [Streptomyces sp. SID13588]
MTQTLGRSGSPLVDHLFKHSARHPRSIALVSGGGSVTWGELAEQVDVIADHLRDMALPRAGLVGVPVGRDAVSLLRILAVSRASLTPFLFDRDQPSGHASAQLQSAGAWFMRDDGRVERPSLTSTGSGLGPAAYALATSGSTGGPKVVSVANEAVRRYECGLLGRLGSNGPLSALLLYPLCVDIGMTAVVAAFATGGTLHILGEAGVRDPGVLARYIAENEIDLLKITPSHLYAVQQGDPTAAVPRRLLILGGEPVPSGFAQSLVRANPGCAVYNHYGPSETAVGVSMHRLTPSIDASAPVCLGDPLPGVDFAVGAGSELLIQVGESGLGYVGDPRETARRFVPDPTTGAARGTRVFRSGDEVRLDESGRPVFVARLDDQVKIRGHRVDLGEVDAALRSLDGIEDAAAAVDAQRVVAIVVSGGTWEPLAVIGEMRAILPEPMVPNVMAIASAVPRGMSGKVDRARVLELAKAQAPRPADALGPAPAPGGLVGQILNVLADTLGSDDLTAEADFFEHGGDSLLAMTAVWQIRLETGIEVTLADLVEGRSAQGLSQLLSAGN